MKTRGFLIKTVVAALTISLLVLLFETKVMADQPLLAFGLIPWFFFVITHLVQGLLKRILERNRNRFTQAYMGLSFGKLLFYSLAILVYLFLKGPQPLPFALICLVCYFLFTTLQLLEFLSLTKGNAKD